MLKRNLNKIKFGIEIEFTGLKKEKVLNILENYFKTTKTIVNGRSAVLDNEGRAWLVVRDSSISSMIPISEIEILNDGYISEERIRNIINNNQHFKDTQIEIVSPVCKIKDIETIQEIIRLIKKAGATVNDSCGIHIHIDKKVFNVANILNLVVLMENLEKTLFNVFSINKVRRIKYCKNINSRFSFSCSLLYDKYKNNQLKEDTIYNRLMVNYYSYHCNSNIRTTNQCLEEIRKKYSRARYYGLNLHSYFRGDTVEFRYFNSSLHAGIVKAYIYFVLAVSIKAIEHKDTSRLRYRYINSLNYDKWFKNFGLDGENFKTVRTHIIRGLKDDTYFSAKNKTSE